MQEFELTADITKETFDTYIQRFTSEWGSPTIKKRISFMVLIRGTGLDTRIKITNGEAKIVQKIKSPPNQGLRTNQEIEIDIPNSLNDVRNSIKLLENFFRDSKEDVLKLVIQHENYIWEREDFELKLSRQFGKDEIFSYEIESFCDKSPLEFQHELRVKPDFDSFSEERQHLRRNFVDIKFSELSGVELDDLILKYLEF